MDSIISEDLDIGIVSAALTKSLRMQGPSADCGFHESGGDVSVFQSSLPRAWHNSNVTLETVECIE